MKKQLTLPGMMEWVWNYF